MIIVFTIFLTILGTVVGQLLVKKGMMVAGSLPTDFLHAVIFLFKNTFLNPYLLIGLFCAFLASMSWSATLSKTSLSFAYPFMSLSFPIVLLLSGLIFGEIISITRWFGMGIIMIGLIIVARS